MVLADVSKCKPAAKLSLGGQLFSACSEGRKKAFDQGCVPICTSAEMSVTSFEACKAISRNKGGKFTDWCRKVSLEVLACPLTQSISPNIAC